MRRENRGKVRRGRIERANKAAPLLYKAVRAETRGQYVHGISQGNPCSSVDRKPLEVRADLVELRSKCKSRRE